MLRRSFILVIALPTLLLLSAHAGQIPKGNTPNSLPPPVVPPPTAPPSVPVRPERVDISINTSRPLAKAADELQLRFGVPISYEDIQWVHPSDVMPVGAIPDPSVRKLKNLDMLVPALASLSLHFDIDLNTRQPISPLQDVLQAALDDHVRRSNPGEFKVIKLGDEEGFSIVPSRSKNLQGALVPALSPLDARISFPELERSGPKTLGVILDGIAAATGAKLSVLSGVPIGPVKLGANQEVARDVLLKALKTGYDWKTYWRFYYGPDDRSWGINFGAFYEETGALTREGKPEIRAVRWAGRPSVRP